MTKSSVWGAPTLAVLDSNTNLYVKLELNTKAIQSKAKNACLTRGGGIPKWTKFNMCGGPGRAHVVGSQTGGKAGVRARARAGAGAGVGGLWWGGPQVNKFELVWRLRAWEDVLKWINLNMSRSGYMGTLVNRETDQLTDSIKIVTILKTTYVDANSPNSIDYIISHCP